jgi:hypothetical protein
MMLESEVAAEIRKLARGVTDETVGMAVASARINSLVADLRGLERERRRDSLFHSFFVEVARLRGTGNA